MEITDPTQIAHRNWTALCVVTRHLVSALRRCTELRPEDHTKLLRDRIDKLRRQWGQESEEYFDSASGKITEFERRCLIRGQKTG